MENKEIDVWGTTYELVSYSSYWVLYDAGEIHLRFPIYFKKHQNAFVAQLTGHFFTPEMMTCSYAKNLAEDLEYSANLGKLIEDKLNAPK